VHAQALPQSNANQSEPTLSKATASAIFYKNTMNVRPFLPSNLDTNIQPVLSSTTKANHALYQTSTQANYNAYGWEQRVSHDWSFFTIPSEEGKVLVIDIKQHNGEPAYRYLANANSHAEHYEPWSSSKIFAYSGAMAKLRMLYPEKSRNEVGKIGEHNIADMITSINSYEPFGLADGNSNALATFFANLATRDFLSALFYDKWLKLSTPNIFFRGAYGPVAFEPNAYRWLVAGSSQGLTMNNIAAQDKGYLPYRCDACKLTGNKPMTTLAQAEWLKRLAMHSLDSATAHPYLSQADVNTLFYGIGHSQNPTKMAGMTLGISTMLQHAIATELSNKMIPLANTPKTAKAILDQSTSGKWRVFQKIGWGPSETRSASENVVLAFVYLPSTRPETPARSFVIAAQVSVDQAKEENVALAGMKMQTLLNKTMQQYMHMN
jgi:hypothetical protein